MRLHFEQLPPVDRGDFNATLRTLLQRVMQQLNQLSEGRLYACHTAASSAPTGGEYTVGDFVPNSGRGVELGSPGSKYTLQGWVCSSESPLTFLEVRCPTGN